MLQLEPLDATFGATVTDIELAITGMTCASCANRIERKLNKLDGVTATVNYATEKARVSHAGAVTVQDLIATVEATGYTAREPALPARGNEPVDGLQEGRLARAVGPDHADELVLLDAQRDAAQDERLAVTGLQPIDLEERPRAHSGVPR